MKCVHCGQEVVIVRLEGVGPLPRHRYPPLFGCYLGGGTIPVTNEDGMICTATPTGHATVDWESRGEAAEVRP